MNDTSEVLTAEDRALFGGLADILIPRAEGMPSASEAEVPTLWAEQALQFRPDLVAGVRSALAISRDLEPAEAIEVLHRDHPDVFEALGTITAGAYFMNPEVRVLLGYPGQQPQPIVDDVDTYVDLLERVVERGQVYRDAPRQAKRLP